MRSQVEATTKPIDGRHLRDWQGQVVCDDQRRLIYFKG